jgi:hypothetical protein
MKTALLAAALIAAPFAAMAADHADHANHAMTKTVVSTTEVSGTAVSTTTEVKMEKTAK